MQMISSACCILCYVLLSYTSPICSVQAGLGTTLSSGQGFLVLAGADQAPGWERLLVWGRELSRPAPCQIPCSHCTTVLALQMSKPAIWDYYLDIEGKNLVFQDQSAGCCKPLLPSLSQLDAQKSIPTDSSTVPMGGDWSGGLQNPQCWESWISHPGLSFLTGEPIGSGKTSWCGVALALGRGSAIGI